MNKWEYRRRVRHNKMSDDIGKRNRHRCAAAMAVCVLANIAWRISRSRYAACNLRRRHTRNRLMTWRMKSHKRHAAHQCSGLWSTRK